ncbi:MAG: hypothetical protein ACE5E6_12840, partial [Phycisphaerae bacterium]
LVSVSRVDLARLVVQAFGWGEVQVGALSAEHAADEAEGVVAALRTGAEHRDEDRWRLGSGLGTVSA